MARAAAVLLGCVATGATPSAAQSLGLAPAEVQHRFKPGQPFQFDIVVSNGGTSPVLMRPTLTDLWYDENNQKVFNPPGSSPRSAANWMQVVPPEITVPAGGSGHVKIFVTPPADASGGYYAVVFLESGPQPTASTATEGRRPVFAKIRLGSLVLLSAENTEQYDVDISDIHVTPPDRAHALTLDFLLSNTSNAHIFPQPRLAILNSRHQLVAKAEGEVKRFLPAERDRLAVEWTGPLPAGDYVAILTVSFGPDQLRTEELGFRVTEP